MVEILNTFPQCHIAGYTGGSGTTGLTGNTGGTGEALKNLTTAVNGALDCDVDQV